MANNTAMAAVKAQIDAHNGLDSVFEFGLAAGLCGSPSLISFMLPSPSISSFYEAAGLL